MDPYLMPYFMHRFASFISLLLPIFLISIIFTSIVGKTTLVLRKAEINEQGPEYVKIVGRKPGLIG